MLKVKNCILKYLQIILIITLIGFNCVNAQLKMNSWDNTSDKFWPAGFEEIEIISTKDKKIQKAVVYKSTNLLAQPLIISLHTWSGNYLQEDPLAKEVKLRNWNYIHPDFRGPNDRPEACGSEFVISDIEDVINYSKTKLIIDTNNIHIIGASGGAYTSLMVYMLSEVNVKSINTWVPISDLEAWYQESLARKSKYAEDIRKIALQDGTINIQELENRSPMYLKLNRNIKELPELNIYAGINDGYTGSVPISHSISFYNKIVSDLYPDSNEFLFSESEQVNLVINRANPRADTSNKLSGRVIHSKKQIGKITATIFEGSHEMLVEPALSLLPINEVKCLKKLNILTIGDSNGEFSFGWVEQMKKLMPFSIIINHSIAGNTIGFDNNDNPELNTIKNIDKYLEKSISELPDNQNLDFILIGLGTNDTKNIFKDDQDLIKKNLHELVKKMQSFFKNQNRKTPVICLISPPPVEENINNTEKYSGSEKRLELLRKSFKKFAHANKIEYIDCYQKLKSNFHELNTDGIHLNENGQFIMAKIIIEHLMSTYDK